VSGQQVLMFDYDERTVVLARELALMVAPYLAPGTTTDTTKALAERLAKAAEARYKYEREPAEVLCHLCDATTTPKDRVRVAVCVRCSLEPRSPGSTG
jgi:hypothetical protein